MRIEILGPGCPNCEALGLEAEVVKVTDLAQITAHGVLMTPALVVDGDVKSSGKVLTPARIRDLLAT